MTQQIPTWLQNDLANSQMTSKNSYMTQQIPTWLLNDLANSPMTCYMTRQFVLNLKMTWEEKENQKSKINNLLHDPANLIWLLNDLANSPMTCYMTRQFKKNLKMTWEEKENQKSKINDLLHDPTILKNFVFDLTRKVKSKFVWIYTSCENNTCSSGPAGQQVRGPEGQRAGGPI